MTNDLNLFFDNFDKLAESSGGVQKLRELILQLAVQGKLVPQDSNDEPASELLKNIKAEKEKLIKEGKIKKQKHLPPINPDNIPYKLPEGWEWSRLGEIVDYNGAPKVSPTNIPQDAWLLGLEDIEKDSSIILKRVLFGERLSKSSKAKFSKNDVLYGKLRPYLNKVVVADSDGYCTTEILPLRGYCGIYPKYLMYSLKRPDFLNYVNSKTYGVKMPRLGTNDGRSALMPLPPLSEQKRIVKKVNELMALCDKLEAKQEKTRHARVVLNKSAIDHLLSAMKSKEFNKHWQLICENFDQLYDDPNNVDKLRQAILQLAIQGKLVPQDSNDEPASELLKNIKAEKEKLIKEGKIKKQKHLPPINPDNIPYKLPEGWEWALFGEIGITQTGTTPPKAESKFFGDDFPFIKPGDISNEGVNFNNEGLSILGLAKGRLVTAGSALMVCIGGSIGKVAYVDRDCSCNQQINFITPYLKISNKLIAYFMRSPYFQNEVLSRAPQTTLPILSKGKWDIIPFPLPPITEQKRIVKKVDELTALCGELKEKIKQSKEKSEKLMNATIHRLLVA